MTQESTKLGWFNTIFKNLQQLEGAYIELAEFGVEYSFGEYFNAHLNLSDEMKKNIDTEKLTPVQLRKYKAINEGIYTRLQNDYPQLHSIGSRIDDIFYTAYEAAESAIESKLNAHGEGERPFFVSGFASLSIFIPEYSLLGIMLNDKLFTPDHFQYNNGVMSMDIVDLNTKFGLTGQEYQLYEEAYRACVNVLGEKLKVNSSIYSRID